MDWKIQGRTPGCARCERPFEDGEAHFSLLLVGEESFGREDRCVACFEAGEAPAEDAVFWRTRRRVQAKRGLAVDFESVEHLFLALEGRTEPRLAELRYLLSLLLMRKKRVKLVRVRRDADGEWMIVRRPRRDESLRVKVFELTAERAGELRAELERIFEGAGAEDLVLPAEDGADGADEADGAHASADGPAEAATEAP